MRNGRTKNKRKRKEYLDFGFTSVLLFAVNVSMSATIGTGFFLRAGVFPFLYLTIIPGKAVSAEALAYMKIV